MVPLGLEGVTILVVDDDPDSLELMGMFLRPTGAAVVEARDGYEALLKAQQEPPDIVFCDLRMPRLDGHELLYQFQRDEVLRDIPMVATTGLGDDVDVMHTCLAGFAGHLVKPITPAMVDALLGEVLQRRPPRANQSRPSSDAHR